MKKLWSRPQSRLWLFALGVILITVIILIIVTTGQELPETRPQSFSVTYKAYTPTVELYEDIVIAPLGSYYQYSYKNHVSRINFTLSEAELDAVYDIFRSSAFIRLPSVQDSLANGEAGTLVTLKAGRHEHTVVETPAAMIGEAWAGSWQFVRQAIFAVRGREFQDQAIPLSFQFDATLLGLPVSLYLNREQIFQGEIQTQFILVPFSVNKIPGDYLLEVSLGEALYGYSITVPDVIDFVVGYPNNQLTINNEPMYLEEPEIAPE